MLIFKILIGKFSQHVTFLFFAVFTSISKTSKRHMAMHIIYKIYIHLVTTVPLAWARKTTLPHLYITIIT